jgi:molybdenum cofactor guanylyltransferase
MSNASAIVLAGGRSSRMGTAKALLLFDGEPLIVHIVAALRQLFAEVVVVSAPGQDLPAIPARLVRDDVAHQGPVGGIYYGLKALTNDVGFVTACDCAFLSPPLIAHLVSQISGHDVVVPYWHDRFQPVHAVYRRSVLPMLEQQLARGELRPVSLFEKVRTRKIEHDEIRQFDPQGSSFFNMNTPDDYAEAVRRWNDVHARRDPETARSIDCTVELFGFPRLLAQTNEVSLVLPPRASYADAFAALGRKLPALVGRVISPDGSRLLDGYACAVNGLHVVRAATARVSPGDAIVILSADAGG